MASARVVGVVVVVVVVLRFLFVAMVMSVHVARLTFASQGLHGVTSDGWGRGGTMDKQEQDAGEAQVGRWGRRERDDSPAEHRSNFTALPPLTFSLPLALGPGVGASGISHIYESRWILCSSVLLQLGK